MTTEFIWSPFIVGSMPNTSLSDCHHESSHLSSGTKHSLTSSFTRQGLARSRPSYSHSLRYWRRLFLAAHSQKDRDNGVLAGTLGLYSPIHPQHQSGDLRRPKVGQLVFYSLLHLAAFSWEAHGKSLATFLSGTKKMPESLAPSKFIYLSHTVHTAVSPRRERRHREPPNTF